jgi:hypothetical protein
MTATKGEYCPTEDAAGRLCKFGPGHQGACQFRTYVPTPAQEEVLHDVAEVAGVRRMQCVGTTTLASLRALQRRGFLHVRYINSRTYDVTLTPAGRRLHGDLPR